MSFAEAVAALRNLFNVSAELPLAAAVDGMRSSMSIEATRGRLSVRLSATSMHSWRRRSLCGLWAVVS